MVGGLGWSWAFLSHPCRRFFQVFSTTIVSKWMYSWASSPFWWESLKNNFLLEIMVKRVSVSSSRWDDHQFTRINWAPRMGWCFSMAWSLVGGLEPWTFMTFHEKLGMEHPNWRSPSFFRGVENKMKPTNPNAHTYVNGTDVNTHGYAVTHNTFLQ